MPECRTLNEVLSAIESGSIPNIVEGDFSLDLTAGPLVIVISGKSSPTIRCWRDATLSLSCRDASFPTVECRDDSTSKIECLDASAPRITSRDRSTSRVVCQGSSSPQVICDDTAKSILECFDTSSPILHCWHRASTEIVAKGGSHPRLIRGMHHITATPSVRVSILRGDPTIFGTTQIFRVTGDTPEAWCKFWNVPIQEDGTVTLFKALDAGFKATRNYFQYLPGSCPVAPDWDPDRECGGGLHFSPTPREALAFNPWARHFVACPILLSEIKTHMISGAYPEKVKAPRVAKPCYEVDILGNPLTRGE
jgi:hypothetical protein